ncbi:MAG: hypothetical protein ACOCUR_00915 [Nanoarchaeota archaeon]
MRGRNILLVCMLFLLVLPLSFADDSADDPADDDISRVPDGIYFVRPTSSEKETVDFRPEYVTGEHVVFFSCIERASKVFNSVYCKDNPAEVVPLETYPWTNGCHISSYNMSETSCTELVVMAEYQQNDEILRWQEEIVITDIESIPYILLDTQSADGGWGDPVSTAWVIWALSEFSNDEFQTNTYATQIESGLRWLKNNRDESSKCWPKEECNTKITAEVLAMLNEANLTSRVDLLRIVHDASVWLSLQQNLFNLRNPTEDDSTDENWKALITGVDWTEGSVNADYSSCLIKYGDELDMTLQALFDVTYEINFTPKHDEVFDVMCTPNALPIMIKNNRDEVLFNSTTGNVSYRIPGACWHDKTPWNHCDVRTTGYGVTTPIDSVRTNLAMDWLRGALSEDDVGFYFDTSEPFFDTAWFLYKGFGVDDDSETDDLSDMEAKVLRWLIFNQNNDGSWGNVTESFDENLLPTAMASIALSRVNNGSLTEYIKDSSIWISQNRPVDGWDTVRKDALSFLAFSRSAKPFILPRDGLIVMRKNEIDVELYNPSSFDFNSLEFKLSGNISEYIEIDTIGSLASDYYKDIRLKILENPSESVFGYISVLNEGYEIGKFPVLVQQVPEISLTLQKDTISVYNGKGQVVFDVDKSSNVALDCALFWEDPTVTSKRRFSVDKQKAIETDFVLSEVRNKQEDYEGYFECSGQGMNMTFPFVLSTTQFESVPFSVYPKTINMTSTNDDVYFTIQNNVDMEILVNSDFETEDPFMIIDNPQVAIAPLDSVDIKIVNFIEDNESVVWDNIIKVSAYDRNEYVTVMVELDGERSFSVFGLFFVFIIVFGVLGAAGYLVMGYKSKIISYLPESIKSKIPQELLSSSGVASVDESKKHPMEKKVDVKNFVHIAEIVKIMKGLGKDDDEISKRLLNEGYSRGEINEVFNRVQEEMDAQTTLVKEDKFMKLMKDLDSDVGAVRNKLKQDGFTDAEIREAFKQAEEEITKKKTELDKSLKDSSKYDVSKEDAEKSEGEKGESSESESGKEEGEKKE